MKKKTLKQLKDNKEFKFNNRGVTHTLLRKDRKSKTATYQSCNSNWTWEVDWDKTVFVIE